MRKTRWALWENILKKHWENLVYLPPQFHYLSDPLYCRRGIRDWIIGSDIKRSLDNIFSRIVRVFIFILSLRKTKQVAKSWFKQKVSNIFILASQAIDLNLLKFFIIRRDKSLNSLIAKNTHLSNLRCTSGFAHSL